MCIFLVDIDVYFSMLRFFAFDMVVIRFGLVIGFMLVEMIGMLILSCSYSGVWSMFELFGFVIVGVACGCLVV